jgi:hypothetical protein
VRGRKRCRMHRGKSTGPRTPEGMARMRRGVSSHGRYAGANHLDFGPLSGPFRKGLRVRRREATAAIRSLGGMLWYAMTKRPKELPRDERGRFRKPYSDEEGLAGIKVERGRSHRADSNQAGYELAFKLDHSMGAVQPASGRMGSGSWQT